MNVAPATSSAQAGMRAAQAELDRASHAIANVNATAPYRPLEPDATLGAPAKLDLATEIAATITAPVLYAANARVVRTADRARGSLIDALG